MRRSGSKGKVSKSSKASALGNSFKKSNFDNREFFPSIHYGIFDFVRDESPSNVPLVDSPNLKNYMFVAESSGGTAAEDPVSKIWVYDVSTPSANPSSFVWTVDSSDVPDFKNANEIMINGNDIFIVYHWRPSTQPINDSNPSRLVKFTNVSIDFSGESVSYDSAEDIELTGLASVHHISKDSTYGYVTCRRDLTASPFDFETKIGRFSLSEALSCTAISIVDGGKLADGTTDFEWYGDLYDGGAFQQFNGIDYYGGDDASVHGNYMYLPVTAVTVDNGVISKNNPNRNEADGIGRVDLSDIENTLELVFAIDTGYLGHSASTNFYVPYMYFKSKDSFLYVYTSRVSSNHVLVKIDLSNPAKKTYKSLKSVMDKAPGGRNGYAHCLRIWKDKIVVTNAGHGFVGVFNQSDLSEVGHVFMENLEPSLLGVSITDDIAVIGDYVYLPLEGGVKKLYSLNLNEINDPTLTEIQEVTNDLYAAVYYDNIM
jgi:hypothetical protein|tara:strand:+ start:3254 stop:4711 length:1458 start_codon:yes stop_codon:yes gene_type:complete